MPARPLRPGEEPPKGTAVLKGQVLASTGGPVRRAQVRAMSMEGRGGGVTSTDSEGRYEIKELAAGRYNITAGKGGFVQGNYGQRRAGEPGTPIDLSDGQTADKVNFVLSRGSVIAGKIVDDGGEPVSGTMVAAVRYQFMAGTRRLVPGGGEGSTDRTDDQGNFRLFGLPPGDYYVSASNRSTMMMQGVNNTEADGFAPTYFPGTPNIAEATRVTVRAGQEMTGASFALIVARMAKVRGRAMNSHGEPVSNAMLMLMPDEPVVMPMNFNNAMAAGDGTFQFANVPPGRYNLQVRPSGMPSATSEFATLKVTVGNDDIDNLIVITSAGLTARGVVLTDDGSVPTFRASQVSIFAQPAEPGSMMMGPGQNRVNDDYTFELTSLSDRRLIRANVGGQTLSWYLKAVMLDGEDVTDSGIEFTPGRSYDGLQIILSQKATDLSGLVSDDRGKPVVDATVVIFPANRDLWTYSSRYMRTTRPDTNGRYSVKWLPPLEDYLIIAVQNLEQGQGGDPEFLSRAAEQAKRLSLNEGELKALDITLSKLVP
jgi:protocatechuate 3,4-dioxygenase beta subunit